MIVLVTGSRTWADRERLNSVLSGVHSITPITLLVHGDCPWHRAGMDEAGRSIFTSADQMADEWAMANKVPVLPFPADWDLLGKKAGPLRNELMGTFMAASKKEGVEVLTVAFRAAGRSPGTDGMVAISRKHGIPTVVEKEGE